MKIAKSKVFDSIKIYQQGRNDFEYDSREDGYNYKNEPFCWATKFTQPEEFSYLNYPDMKKAEDAFSSLFFIPRSNFILCNGCENALRIALAALKHMYDPKMFYFEYPGWRLPYFSAYQTGFNKYTIKPVYFNLDKKRNKIKYDEESISNIYNYDVLYRTDGYNGWFYHKDPKDVSGFEIIDESYTLEKLMNFDDKAPLNPMKIYIGSFSKAIGPGYRLAYIIFPQNIYKIINMCKEQYISKSAYDKLMELKEKPDQLIYFKDKIKEFTDITKASFKNGEFETHHLNYDSKAFKTTKAFKEFIDENYPEDKGMNPTAAVTKLYDGTVILREQKRIVY